MYTVRDSSNKSIYKISMKYNNDCIDSWKENIPIYI